MVLRVNANLKKSKLISIGPVERLTCLQGHFRLQGGAFGNLPAVYLDYSLGAYHKAHCGASGFYVCFLSAHFHEDRLRMLPRKTLLLKQGWACLKRREMTCCKSNVAGQRLPRKGQ